MLADVCFIDISKEFIADPRIGDNLFAIGFDGKSSKPRLWSGIVLSLEEDDVEDDTSYFMKHTDRDPTNVTPTRKVILTSGNSVRGMSGAPVFNGCGLSGIGVAASFSREVTTEGTDAMWMLGTMVIHVDHIMQLVLSEEAPGFAIRMKNPKICKIPIKEYCKLST